MALTAKNLKNIRLVGEPGVASILGRGSRKSAKFGGFHPPRGWPREYGVRERRYGTYDGMFPAIWDSLEAYAFSDGVWHKHRSSDMLWNAGLMAQEEFDATFPNLPPLPESAFLPKEQGPHRPPEP